MAYEPELEKLERRYQDDPARNFAQLAERYRKDGRLEDALTLLRGHLADRPNYVSGLVVLGRCLLDQQADGEARETFERVLGVDAEHIIALRALGEIAERAGDRDGAQSWFTRLLDVDPMNEEAQAALERIATMEAAPPEAAAPVAEPAESIGTAEPVEKAETVEPAEEEVLEARTAEFTGHEQVPQFEATLQTDDAQPETTPEAAAEDVTEPVGEQSVEEPGAGEGKFEESAAGEPFEEAAADEATVEEAASESEEEPREPAEAAGWTVEKETDAFLPRASQRPPMDIEQYSDIEISSQLPEEAPLIGGGAEPEDEPYQFPTGEQEVDLGLTEPPAEAEAAAEREAAAETDPTAEAAVSEDEAADEELAVEPFDDSLGWGVGERISRQITQDDIAEAEHAQEDGLDQVFHQLPGLESAEPPSEGDLTVAETVEGLEAYEPPAEEVLPIEGLEPTHAEAPATEEFTETVEQAESVEPVEAVEVAEPAESGETIGPAAIEPTGIDESEGFYVPPEAEAAAVEAGEEDESRGPVEHAAPPEGLPDMGQPKEPETPLVLDAEPEPVVTETMAELYARQGLVNEAREVYQQLLAQHPGDRALTEKLADLEREMAGAHGRRTGTFSAIATGGESARAFLGAILAAQPAVVVAPAPGPSEEAPAPEPGESASETTVEIAAVEVTEPTGPGPMDEAFGDEDAESEAEGAPTQPADDEVSLSNVFGDDTPTATTAPSPAPEPPQAPKDRAPGGFSFDEFFGKAASEGAETPRRDSITDDEGDEAFKDWLKGLRT